MARIVQKYGGTSVADNEHTKFIAEHIKHCYLCGDELIVIVSARAGRTNELLEKAYSISKNPNRAELDALLHVGELENIALLAITLNELGIPAVSRNAYQSGIFTCSSFGNARIKNIAGGDVEECLANKKVVIIAGFQGIDEYLQPTTLGRGGSDLTAIALAHRFQADKCEIFTDVDGVFSADPHVVKAPYLINNISHESLLRLSFFDNKVMQDRSIALAKKFGVNFRIASSQHFDDVNGTSVNSDWNCDESCVIGLTYKKNLSMFRGISTQDIFNNILQFFADKKIDLSFIKHSTCPLYISFLDEISIDTENFQRINEQFLINYSKFYKFFDFVHQLDRIDIVGTNLEYSQWLRNALSVVFEDKIFRAEYGKNGLSFLIKGENFETIMNKLHDIVFT